LISSNAFLNLPHLMMMIFFKNARDFTGKVVLDVGTGTGVLAFFAVQAGARLVYAVEASDMSVCAQALVDGNDWARDKIKIIRGKLETIELPEKVDIIVSEPLGFLLVHERMLETYLLARERFLKPEGLMMPTTGNITFGPISDEALHSEQMMKRNFWERQSFYGINLSPLVPYSQRENFSHPVVGYFYSASFVSADRAAKLFDFSRLLPEELHSFDIPYRFRIDRTAIIHGIGCWFDVAFCGQQRTVVLSTAPDQPGTHWY